MRDSITLSSSASTQTSLDAIFNGKAGLSVHRKKLLERVPNSNDWVALPVGSLKAKDIAFLSAATHHEFAILRGKTNDILFHGTERHCFITGELFDLLRKNKLRLIAHSHSDRGHVVPSKDDRDFLKYIGQKSSTIISYVTGVEIEFSADIFDEYDRG